MRLAIGCPMWKRDWALGHWLGHAEQAAEAAGVIPEYVIVIDPRDEPSHSFLRTFSEEFDRDVHFEFVEETRAPEDRRIWNRQRYERMAYLRNLLLARVRRVRPDFFLSLDSDIFLHPYALVSMLETADMFDAVGGKTYLHQTSRNITNYGMLNKNGTLKRADADGVFAVDVIMAIKLMNEYAYGVDYVVHQHGEDIGWSINARAAGLSLGWDGRVCSKHAMSPDMLERVDERCGF